MVEEIILNNSGDLVKLRKNKARFLVDTTGELEGKTLLEFNLKSGYNVKITIARTRTAIIISPVINEFNNILTIMYKGKEFKNASRAIQDIAEYIGTIDEEYFKNLQNGNLRNFHAVIEGETY